MIVDAAMLVINDQQGRALPEIRVLSDSVVYRCNEQFSGLYMMVRMLVVSEFFATVAVVIAVVRLNKAIFNFI